MAVNVDTVYKTVLLILNKEQRGYITPDEFNKIGTQVQREILEQYFEELNQQLRVPQNSNEYANRVKNLEEKIDIFQANNACTGANPFTLPNNDVTTGTLTVAGTGYSTSGAPQATTGGSGTGCTVNIIVTGGGPGPVASFTIAAGGDDYQIGDVLTISGGGGNATITVNTISGSVHRLGMLAYREKEIQVTNRKDHFLINKSSLTTPTISNPVYILEGTGAPSAAPSQAYVFPGSITSDVTAYYVRTPLNPRWGYSVGNLGQYLHDSTVYGANLLNNEGNVLGSVLPNLDLAAGNFSATVIPNVTAGVTTPSTGTGLTLNLTITLGNGITGLSIVTPGTGYSIGDQITFASGIFGGAVSGVLTLAAADFNSGSTYGSTDFELHPTEQPNIIMNVLMYCGVVIRDPQIVQNAAQMIAQDEQLEKS